MTMDIALAPCLLADSTSPNTYTAAVWERSGMLPATITIAPNSPIARAKLSNAPLLIGNQSAGKVTRQNMVAEPAPNVAAPERWQSHTPEYGR